MNDGVGDHDLPDRRRRDERRERHDATPDGLSQAHDVRSNTPVIYSPEFPGSSHTGLDLVGNEQGTVLGAELTSPGEVVGGWNHSARLPLYRLQDNARDLGTHGLRAAELGCQRVGIAVGDEAYVLESRLERLPE